MVLSKITSIKIANSKVIGTDISDTALNFDN